MHWLCKSASLLYNKKEKCELYMATVDPGTSLYTSLISPFKKNSTGNACGFL